MRVLRTMISGSAALLALSGCGGDSNLDGSVAGGEFGDVASAFFMTATSADGIDELWLVMANYPEACASYVTYHNLNASPSEDPPLNALFVQFYQLEPVTAGTYEIMSSEEASGAFETIIANFRRFGDSKQWETTQATGGSITISTLDAATMEGTVTASFADGSLEGSFVATFCDSDF